MNLISGPLNRRALMALLVPAIALVRGIDASAKGSGKKLAKEARKYKGDRYVYAGDSPKHGFDCSGLTMYVVDKILGMDITHSVKQQYKFGKTVRDGDWEPGDLVFFRKTDGPGLTHVGIYLGKNEFIHAENENTGVVITDIYSDYYQKHYAGARRLA